MTFKIKVSRFFASKVASFTDFQSQFRKTLAQASDQVPRHLPSSKLRYHGPDSRLIRLREYHSALARLSRFHAETRFFNPIQRDATDRCLCRL